MKRKKGGPQSKSWHAGQLSDSQMTVESPYISECIYKVVVIGGEEVGKTSVIRALCGEEFSPDKIKTYGIDFRRKMFLISKQRVKANIWDTCYGKSYLQTLPNTLKGCDGVVIVFDKSKTDSFDVVTKVQKIVEECCEEAVPILLLGNKADTGEYENLSHDIKNAILNSKRNIHYRETIACTGDGIEEAFEQLLKAIIKTAHMASDSRKSYRDTKNTLAKASIYSQNERRRERICCKN